MSCLNRPPTLFSCRRLVHDAENPVAPRLEAEEDPVTPGRLHPLGGRKVEVVDPTQALPPKVEATLLNLIAESCDPAAGQGEAVVLEEDPLIAEGEDLLDLVGDIPGGSSP